MKTRLWAAAGLALCVLIALAAITSSQPGPDPRTRNIDPVIHDHAHRMLGEGRQTFRFDTFGDEAFWGDQLRLHLAIEGKKLGGVGPGLSPKAALQLGLKVDADALPPDIVQLLREGKVNLDDPAITLALLRLNAVVGVTGFFNNRGTLRSVGIQCALCHSTVNDSLAPGSAGGWTAGPTATSTSGPLSPCPPT